MKNPSYIITFLLSLFLLPYLYDMYIDRFPEPIVDKMSMNNIELKDGVLIGIVTGQKGRACDPVLNSWVGYAKYAKERSWMEVPFNFIDDVKSGSSRPIGANNFGKWGWTTARRPLQVIMLLKHICPNQGAVTTTVGPFKIP